MSPELELAIDAARAAGVLLRENYETPLEVDEMHTHDIKLALDVKSQDLITGKILETFPDHAIYGEEGLAGNQESPNQWIVDPIDGTVNFFYGLPHFCISIAMRREGKILIGVIYDPLLDELYAVDFDGPPTRNGKPISCSPREELKDAVVTIGFSKSREAMDVGLARYRRVAYRVRKTRMLGSAAMAMAFVACGRLDAFVEEEISLWDIAAGVLLVERAGGSITMGNSRTNQDKMSIIATNGKIPLIELLNQEDES